MMIMTTAMNSIKFYDDDNDDDDDANDDDNDDCRIDITQSYGDGGQESLGYIGNDDTDEEDDGVEPVVAKDESDDKEGDAEENCHSRYDVDEVGNLTGNWSLTHLETRRKVGNPTHNCSIARKHNQTSRRSYSKSTTSYKSVN